MKPLDRQRILDLLSPEAFAYLFPGMGPCVQAADSVIPEPPAPHDFNCFDGSAEKETFERNLVRQSVLRRVRRPAKETTAASREDPDALDPRTAALLKEIERIQKEYGVSIEDLEILLGYHVTLSPLHITRTGKLFLPAFDGVEVKMDNISKSLYFLYLRHSEGLRFKDVADHREELLGMYRSITGREDPEEIEKSIDHLVDPYGNALNVSASRIKIAFRNVVSDRVARFYYINGSAREVKKVPLDRDLVIWL